MNDKRDPVWYHVFFGDETTIGAFLSGVDQKQYFNYPKFGDAITIEIWHDEEAEDDMEYLLTWSYNGEMFNLTEIKNN